MEDGGAGEMTAARAIRPAGPPPDAPLDAGPKPELKWVEIKKIFVEAAYQRDIGERGLKNIRQIAQNFRWSRFTPVILAPRGDGTFALIDGQHRATAAATLGIASIPAQIVEMSARERAEAFTYINGAVTALSVMAKFHAAVAAGHASATAAQRALDAAKARILKYPVPASKMKVGDSLAAATLILCAERFGEKPLASALKGLVRRGNPGDLTAPVIEAAARLVASRPKWKPAEIEAHIAGFDLLRLINAARQRKVGLSTKISVLLFQEMEMATPDAYAEVAAKARARAIARPDPATPAGAIVRALDDALITLAATKAGIVFGCNRNEVFAPKTDAQFAARAAVFAWLSAQGCAGSAIVRRLPGAAIADLEDEAVGLQVSAPAKFERFERIMVDAVKHSREVA